MTQKPLIGILGGMGTAAGLYFQNLFFQICVEKGLYGDQNYPEWLYLNASQAADRTAALNQKGPSPVPYLIQCLKKMQTAGVTVVVVTCNTAHVFYEEIIAQVNLPWIHLPNETVNEVSRCGVKEVGLMNTTGALSSDLYQRALAKAGIKIIAPAPDSELQSKIMSVIYDPKFGVKFTGADVSEDARRMLQEIIGELKTDAVILGCTELSVAATGLDLGVCIFDPLRIAALVLLDIWQGKRSV